MPPMPTLTLMLPACLIDTLRRFYDAQNRRDLMSVTQLLASDVSYENLAVADTLQGRTVSRQPGQTVNGMHTQTACCHTGTSVPGALR